MSTTCTRLSSALRRLALIGMLLVATVGNRFVDVSRTALAAKNDKSDYNLMPILKIVHDGFKKFWRREDGVVTPNPTRGPRDFYPLAIHVQPPPEYDFSIAIDCDDRSPSLLILVCPTAKGTVDLKIDADGYSFVGGDDLPEKATKGLLSKGAHHLVMKVRHDAVQAYVDNTQLASFDPTKHPLNKPDALTKGYDENELGVAAGPNITAIRELRLKEGHAAVANVPTVPKRGPRMDHRNITPPEPPDPYAGAATPADIVPGSKPKVSEIRGLVVMQAGDGAYHGKAIDMIATTWATTQKGFIVTPLGIMGQQMRISLEEAKRLVAIRHPDLGNKTIQISFGDKYSPMDGGSGGTAFSILLLSAVGEFEIDPDAALTGDITVDGKIRTVGEVPAKVHGAALDKCKVVSIPASNVPDMDDALLLQGVSAMWETQIFSADTLDSAIANVRKDHDLKRLAAMKLFDDLKAAYGAKPAASLADPSVREKLNRIIELAPNHVSAVNLLRVANGKSPTHLTTVGSVEHALAAVSPCQMSLFMAMYDPQSATPAVTASEKESLEKIRKIADPAAIPFITALDNFLDAYRQWAAAPESGKAAGKGKGKGAAGAARLKELNNKADAARGELTKLGTSSELIDSMLHK